MMRLSYEDIVYTDARCIEHSAVYVRWHEVERYLGERHDGDAYQDERLVRGLIEAGAPEWVNDGPGWVDEYGWGIYSEGGEKVGQ